MRTRRLVPFTAVLAFAALTFVRCGPPSPGPDGGTDGGDGGDASDPAASCGDGVKASSEACDDGNGASGDGCSSTCALESGWVCAFPGFRCEAAQCGDSLRAGDEECDDGNAAAGDGCGSTCQLEDGFKCPNPGQPCAATTCGDGVTEGTEDCDDRNHDMGDGCSPLCTAEPVCSNGQCQSRCGDGVILPNDTTEACDDGNLRAGDGCSSTCQLEPGFECVRVTDSPPPIVRIPVVYRDFRGFDLDGGHIDYQNANGAETGIVGTTLGSDGKPVYVKTTSTTTHGAAAFDQWYRDSDAGMNRTKVSTLDLAQDGGSYVFDSTSFFPLDDAGFVATGEEPKRADGAGVLHNFSFSSEARYWFEYKGTEVLTFRGDDDVWVFINKQRALDLGGVHSAQTGTVDLAASASALGLADGGIYEVAVFQAERHTSASSYRLTLNNFTGARSVCTRTCADLSQTCSTSFGCCSGMTCLGTSSGLPCDGTGACSCQPQIGGRGGQESDSE